MASPQTTKFPPESGASAHLASSKGRPGVMRRVVRSYLAIFAFLAFFPDLRADTTVVVTGLKADSGILLVAVYGDEATWLGKAPLVGLNVPVKRDAAGRVVVAIPGKLPDKVAVAIIHDVNGNQDMDRNAIGIPTEPYGFSRGIRPKFGPPKFQDALIPSNQPIEVKVDTLL